MHGRLVNVTSGGEEKEEGVMSFETSFFEFQNSSQNWEQRYFRSSDGQKICNTKRFTFSVMGLCSAETL